MKGGEVRGGRGGPSSRGGRGGKRAKSPPGSSSKRSPGRPAAERRTTVTSIVESIQRRVSEALGSARPEGRFDRRALMDRLSEFLEHERGGAKLYELGLEKFDDDEPRDRIQEFLDQTRRHEEILTGIILELGGHPDALSESAELDRQKSEALLEADAEGEVGRLNFFQNLFLAELTCHMNWEFLATCLRGIDDEEVRAVLEPHVLAIEDEEDEHVNWAKKQLEECSLSMVFRAGDDAGDDAAEVEESSAATTEASETDEAAEIDDEDDEGEDDSGEAA